MKEQKDVGGRPKIRIKDLPKDWDKETLRLATLGASDVEIRVEALGGICHETWTRLIKEEPIFSETIKKATDLCRAWWERKGRTELENTKFSSTLWYMNMKNRFGWRDKQEQSIKIQEVKPIIDVSGVQTNNSNEKDNRSNEKD